MENYRVGYARVDTTPQESVPLAGFGNTSKRKHKAVRDNLYASCFAITDAKDTTVILISLDIQWINEADVEEVRSRITERLGVPGQNVMISCTHSHAAPDIKNRAEECIVRYQEMLNTRLVLAAELAMSDRMEADVFLGDVEAYRMNFVKHYWGVHKETGETIPVGDNLNGGLYSKLLSHTTEADPTVHLVKFVRKGRQDLILSNFRAHGLLCSGAQKYDLSADWIGGLRSAFESKSDALITCFQGACGNTNPTSRIEEEVFTRDCMAYGKLLADYVLEGLKTMKPLAPAPIKTRQTVMMADARQYGPELVEAARQVFKYWQETNDGVGAVRMGQPLGIHSPYHAGAILARRSNSDPVPIEMDAITLGELAFIAAPNELFDTLTMAVEDNAPYEKVVTLGYANGYKGYIPTKYAFEYTCYEADCSYTAEGTGEKMVEWYLQTLGEMKGE